MHPLIIKKRIFYEKNAPQARFFACGAFYFIRNLKVNELINKINN